MQVDWVGKRACLSHLKRTPGPKALLYSLDRDETLRVRGLRLPRSTRTSLADP
jgi:hypothetical protein